MYNYAVFNKAKTCLGKSQDTHAVWFLVAACKVEKHIDEKFEIFW